MSCICSRCKKQMDDCEFTVCINCYLEMSDDEVNSNIVSGGRFYGEKLEKEEE